MNGPLLIDLLPPERIGEAAKASTDPVLSGFAILFLAGILLSLFLGMQK